MHGMYRSTADIDILADVKPQQVLPFKASWKTDFYVDEGAVREALIAEQSVQRHPFRLSF